MSFICKSENKMGDERIAATSPASYQAITAQVGAVCIALGMLLKNIPQLTGTRTNTGALLIRIGQKLNAPVRKTDKVQ